MTQIRNGTHMSVFKTIRLQPKTFTTLITEQRTWIVGSGTVD